MAKSNQQGRRPAQRAALKLPPQRVEIDFVVLGDFAQESSGKLTIVGAGWTLVNAKQYPVNIPFGVGIGILVPWTETNRRHQFEFTIGMDGGQEIARGGGEFEAGRQTGIPVGMVQRVVVGFAGNISLPQPGTYAVNVKAAGSSKKVTFESLPVPQGPRLP